MLNAMINLVAERGIADRFHFPGFMKGKQDVYKRQEVIFVCPSLSTNTVFMFFLIQLVRQFNDLLCVRFLPYLKELPFDMLQAGDSFNSRIGVTFQFSIRTVCVTLYCPLIFGKKVKKHLPATGTILVEVQYQFLLDRDGRPDIPLPYPFASTVLLFHKDFVVTFITTKIRAVSYTHLDCACGIIGLRPVLAGYL